MNRVPEEEAMTTFAQRCCKKDCGEIRYYKQQGWSGWMRPDQIKGVVVTMYVRNDCHFCDKCADARALAVK